jgi:hypothetical protein
MKRLLTLLMLPVLLSACAFTKSTEAIPRAPLNATVIDDQAINFGYEAFDAVLSLVDAGIASGQIVPGSPKALRIRDSLAETKKWLGIAKTAQEAGSQSDYALAFMQARSAINAARAAIKGDRP